MPSLVILMIEHEQPEGLSSRKLVVETAKHNVLTAYRAESGLVLLRRFLNVDVVLIHSAVLDQLPLLQEMHRIRPDVPIIVVSPDRTQHFEGASFVISSHNPQELLDLLAREFGASRTSDND